MSRKSAEVPIAPVETIRHRLQMSLAEFSEALGYGVSAYGDMQRRGTVTKTVALAAECLSRRQAPGTENELCWLTRIVKGVPITTMLGELTEMTLGGTPTRWHVDRDAAARQRLYRHAVGWAWGVLCVRNAADDVPLICDPVPGPLPRGVLVCERLLSAAEIAAFRAQWEECNRGGRIMMLPPDCGIVSIFEARQWPDAEYCAA